MVTANIVTTMTVTPLCSYNLFGYGLWGSKIEFLCGMPRSFFAESFFLDQSFPTICGMPSLDSVVLVDFCVAKKAFRLI